MLEAVPRYSYSGRALGKSVMSSTCISFRVRFHTRMSLFVPMTVIQFRWTPPYRVSTLIHIPTRCSVSAARCNQQLICGVNPVVEHGNSGMAAREAARGQQLEGRTGTNAEFQHRVQHPRPVHPYMRIPSCGSGPYVSHPCVSHSCAASHPGRVHEGSAG